ncbi:DUF5339 family protein [Chiayiivirga flava]|uniref:Putative small lipoprotein YifL n=1 Tax=Chiayiivirga flava TaxID=659595 RepID=A0A7W8D7V8_9GAMM|nr:DUF5339 family protein [Chiayiivirga flava]MBB5209576.1 putative small lipoprotein YifL [Chiayiivirga flava]
MKLTNKMLLAVLVVSLAACGKKDEPAAPATPATTAPAAAPAPAPATDAPAAPAPAASTPAVAAPAAATSADALGLPTECETYLTRAAACYEKAAAANPAAVAQMQQGLEQVRTQWAAVPDKSQLGAACTMASEQFAQTVAMLKCE